MSKNNLKESFSQEFELDLKEFDEDYREFYKDLEELDEKYIFFESFEDVVYYVKIWINSRYKGVKRRVKRRLKRLE